MRPIALVSLWLLLAGCAHKTLPSATVDRRSFLKPFVLVQLKDKRITESSGIAESPVRPGVFYTHNDSGDLARIFRFTSKGDVEAIKVEGAKNVDWEDIASAKIDGQPWLYIGDIGDNYGRRDTITIYRMREPGPRDTSVRVDQTYRLRYPDEPHNAEALMVQPETGDLYVVTKASQKPSVVFKVPKPAGTGDYTLAEVGRLDLGGSLRESKLVTGGAISPDGKHVVLRTYLAAYEFDAGSRFDDWVKSTPRTIKTNLEGQGEGIAYLYDGEGLVTSSEGVPCQVSEIPLRP